MGTSGAVVLIGISWAQHYSAYLRCRPPIKNGRKHAVCYMNSEAMTHFTVRFLMIRDT